MKKFRFVLLYCILHIYHDKYFICVNRYIFSPVFFSMLSLFSMTELKNLYATFNGASNSNSQCKTWYNFERPTYTELQHEKSQEHHQYSGNDYNIGMKNIFGRDDYSQEPVGELFFSENNVKRIQKLIKEEVYNQSRHKFILEEDQDPSDLLIAMRAVYQMNGKYLTTKIVHQVKELNRKLISYIVPDMMTEMKQYYGYIKDINEPLKPIDRPMNVSNAGRRTLPSVTSMWTV